MDFFFIKFFFFVLKKENSLKYMKGETITCNKISLQFYDQSTKKNGFFSIFDKDLRKVGTLVLFDQNKNSKSAQLRKGIKLRVFTFYVG